MTPLVMLNNIKSPNFPEVPLFADVGYHGPPSRSWYGIFAPAGTPKTVIDRVSKDIGEVINKPEFSDRHLKARSLVPAANTPEQFAEDIKRERVIAEKVVKDAGFEPQ
jgi:tripartite-type tricarboxylate transporter receptor subunit TctC